MNRLPTELVNIIMEYRGTDTFDALNYELTTEKKRTKKWTKDIVQRIHTAYDTEMITEKEWIVFIYNRTIFYHLQPSGPRGEGKSLWGVMPILPKPKPKPFQNPNTDDNFGW